MANVEHSALTDPELHEPKGAAAASAGQIYVADGAASGAFTTINNKDKVFLLISAIDIGTTTRHRIPAPIAGDIVSIRSVIDSALTGADAIMTAKINAVNITNGSWTIAFSGSSAGDLDTATPTGANTIALGDFFSIESDGGPSNNPNAAVTIEIDVS